MRRRCEECDRGELVELLHYSAPALLDGDRGERSRVFKCSSCGAISSSSAADDGQGDLFGGDNGE